MTKGKIPRPDSPVAESAPVTAFSDIPANLFERYERLQEYLGWTDEDVARIVSIRALLEPVFEELIDDFYQRIELVAEAAKVITGGEAQIARLKVSLRGWLEQLFSGRYDREYVIRRWRVGWRHVDIGLNQLYTSMALARLRSQLLMHLERRWQGTVAELGQAARSLNQLIDADLAIIQDAYQAEAAKRQEQIQRLAAIGQVAGGIAHELRNPLNVVKTSVYFLQHANRISAEKQGEHLQRIERQVGVANAVITALSNFARMPLPEFRQLSVERLLREALEDCELPEAVQVRLECPADLPAALGDGDQLKIVLANLFRNARDAMRGAGTLAITAGQHADRVRIAVSDSGSGIAAENLKRIREPLFTTKARGIGLGLAISQAILDRHQAELLVESQLGAGSTFTLLLPAAAT